MVNKKENAYLFSFTLQWFAVAMLWAEAANREEFSRSKWVFLMSLYSSSFSHWVKRKIISCRCCVYWTSQSTNQMMVFWHSDAFFKHIPNKDERRLVHVLKNHHLKRQCKTKEYNIKLELFQPHSHLHLQIFFSLYCPLCPSSVCFSLA